MNPTEPDLNHSLDGVVRRVENVARARGTSRSERWFRSLVQNASDVVAILEADGTLRYVSPSVERVLGYRPEELVGSLAFEHVHPEDIELVSREFAEAPETAGVLPPMEFRARAADGSWRHMETILNNLLDDPAVGGIVANSRDITERKEAEERYRRRSRELALLHQVRTALAQELDLPTVFHKVVEAIAETYGYTQVSAYLLEGEELVLQHEVGYERLIERIPLTEGVSGSAVRTGQPILLEDVRTDPDFLGSIEGLVSEIWEHPHTRGLVLSVNLSASQLQHPRLARTVEQTL